MRRPDRSHYVVDIMPDFVTVKPNDGGEPTRINVVQVWVDPAHPEAHRDPALRAYLATRGEKDGMAALIRTSESEAWLLVPPAINERGEWLERGSRNPNDITMVDKTHSAAEIFGFPS